MHRARSAALLTALTVLAGAAGCVSSGYTNWPPVGGDTASNDVNFGGVPPAIIEAVYWTSRRFPPVADPVPGSAYDQPFAVNLPPGLSTAWQDQLLRRIGPGGDLLRTDNDQLPTYHVARVTIRGLRAEIDVIRPVLGLAAPSDDPTARVHQTVTVYLTGGVGPWRVEDFRLRPVGLVTLPPANFVDVVPARIDRYGTDRPAFTAPEAPGRAQPGFGPAPQGLGQSPDLIRPYDPADLGPSGSLPPQTPTPTPTQSPAPTTPPAPRVEPPPTRAPTVPAVQVLPVLPAKAPT
ncbi:MAG: hypothetical protein C0468_06895, partial [Planctomyces sp.]|nr:hypothetical protein [Planctomyces sp.]